MNLIVILLEIGFTKILYDDILYIFSLLKSIVKYDNKIWNYTLRMINVTCINRM